MLFCYLFGGVGFGGFSFTLVCGYGLGCFIWGLCVGWIFVGWCDRCLLLDRFVVTAVLVFGVNLCVVLVAGWFPGCFGSCGLV